MLLIPFKFILSLVSTLLHGMIFWARSKYSHGTLATSMMEWLKGYAPHTPCMAQPSPLYSPNLGYLYTQPLPFLAFSARSPFSAFLLFLLPPPMLKFQKLAATETKQLIKSLLQPQARKHVLHTNFLNENHMQIK